MASDPRVWLAEALERADKAGDHIGRISAGEDRWRMSVPPRGDDSDLMLITITDIDLPSMAKALLRILRENGNDNPCELCVHVDCEITRAITENLPKEDDRG